MPRTGDKSPQMFPDVSTREMAMSMSKAALADLVADLLIRINGEDNITRPEFIRRVLIEAANPVLKLRGDKLLK